MEKKNAKRPKTICIDFDGVIHDYRRGWRGIDVFDKVLHSPALRNFLKENDICFDYINHNPHQPAGSDQGKIIADVYLDDRGICFTGDWNEAVQQILHFKTWQEDDWI